MPAPRSVWKENKKTTFRGLKSCFFLFCNWKGLLLQWRFGQLEKAPGKVSACSQESLGRKKLFFSNLQLEGSPFAVALWAAGKGVCNMS